MCHSVNVSQNGLGRRCKYFGGPAPQAFSRPAAPEETHAQSRNGSNGYPTPSILRRGIFTTILRGHLIPQVSCNYETCRLNGSPKANRSETRKCLLVHANGYAFHCACCRLPLNSLLPISASFSDWFSITLICSQLHAVFVDDATTYELSNLSGIRCEKTSKVKSVARVRALQNNFDRIS